MKLGNLDLKNPFVQAPMAGVTDTAFRTIARRFHDGLLFTEMVSAEALCRGNWRTLKYVEIPKEHRPIGIQLVGHDPGRIAQAAVLAEKIGLDFIDINAGCPQLKVVGPGAGGALLKKPEKLATIVKQVKSSISIPVSVKIRLGYKKDESLAISQMLQDAGAEFITVHGRTVEQKYFEKSDWHAIKRVVENLDIPVLANGDVKNENDAIELLENTGAEGVMIGRATRGRPDLPGTAYSLLKDGEYQRMPLETLASTIIDHAALEQELFGIQAGIRRMRKHVHWYFRAAGIKCLAKDIYHIKTLEELTAIVEGHILR
ncbi:MAG: tRNA dihydrouridine synthase DusB [Thermoplasmata archaeon]|nr:tRNA dihydrouridine synthase DusB [Thermoplasmata archaeon]